MTITYTAGAAGTYTPEQVSSPELHYRHHSNHEYDDGGDRPSGIHKFMCYAPVSLVMCIARPTFIIITGV